MAGDGNNETIHSPYNPEAFSGPRFRKKREVPDGLWMRCPTCEGMIYRKVVAENLEVCPECRHHFRMSARRRIGQMLDEESFEELFADIGSADPLKFHWAGQSFADRIAAEQAKTGEKEAVLTGIGFIRGRRVALGVMEPNWLMGSLGPAVGEKLTLLIERATADRLPLLIVCASGGARMHEGALSLMQMAKTSAALGRYDDAGGLYVSVLTDPTTGGTTASFAMLADVILAEPGALIGFAGQRVIANTIKADLPEGFQTAEFLLDHGFVDAIVPRSELRSELARLIDYCGK